jgi:hypothetical protein
MITDLLTPFQVEHRAKRLNGVLNAANALLCLRIAVAQKVDIPVTVFIFSVPEDLSAQRRRAAAVFRYFLRDEVRKFVGQDCLFRHEVFPNVLGIKV